MTELSPRWALLTGVALSQFLRGARFDAAQEPAFSLSGLSLEVRLGVGFGL
jgi:hypothetical protein